MKRAVLILCAMTAMLIGRIASAAPEAAEPAAATPAAHVQAGEGGGEHEVPGELVPVDPASQRQALITAIWVVVIFVILLAILYPTAWKGVLAGLKAREERIRKDIADAEAARLKAEASLKEYNAQLASAEEKVRQLIAQATSEGEKMAATIRQKATQEAELVRQKATADIEAAGKQAIVEIHNQTAELATAIAEKIIRRNLNVDDQRELVRASLAQLQKQGAN